MKTNPNSNDIVVINFGKDIIAPTNYWESKFARDGFYMLSTANGCISLLVPDCELYEVPDMVKGTKRVVLSVQNDYENTPDGTLAASISMESGSKVVFALLIGKSGVLSVPSFQERDNTWTFSIWGRKKGKIHKFMERPALVRYVDSVPVHASI